MRIPVGSCLLGGNQVHTTVDRNEVFNLMNRAPKHVLPISSQYKTAPIRVRHIDGITAIDRAGQIWPIYEVVDGHNLFLALVLLGATEVDVAVER